MSRRLFALLSPGLSNLAPSNPAHSAPALRPVRLLTLALSLQAFCWAPALAQSPAAEAPFKPGPSLSMELKNVQWFDGKAFRRGTLFVQDGKFTTQKLRKVHRRMELAGQYLVNPLGEAHNHNLQSEWGLGRFGQQYLKDGVFYAAMLCGDPASVEPVRRQLQQDDGLAQTLSVSFVTACITSSDGHPFGMLMAPPTDPHQPAPRFEDFADKAVIVMDSPQEAEQKWPLVKQRRSDMIKLIMSYHEREDLRGKPELKGKLGLRPDTVAAIVRLAHAAQIKVSAHVDSAADFEAAVRAGVDQIAHLPGYFPHHGDGPERYRLSREVAELAAQRKVQVTTTTAASTLFQASPEQQAAIRDTQRHNLRLLREAGVPLLLGSDVFTATSLAEYRQLAELGGFEPADLLRLATRDTPKALFPKRQIGCFDPGCEASFLVLGSNPLEDPKALESPLLRVAQGRIVTQMEEVAEQAGQEEAQLAAKPSPSVRKGKAAARKGKSKAAAPARGKATGASAAKGRQASASKRKIR